METKLTAEELAKHLRVDKRTIYHWASAGLLPCQRIGRRTILFDEKEIEEYLKKASQREGQAK
jgi:DNA binding domain, excisionase family